jgi:predicted GIY-YIG superfamily endonuclease
MTSVYRLYDKAGVLLYVGASANPTRRMAEHAKWVTLTTRVPRETAETFKAIARSEDRPTAAELRRLIDLRIAEMTQQEAA